MKDPAYPQYILQEGDCHTCILYDKPNNKCKHIYYYNNQETLYCVSITGKKEGVSYKTGLKTILKKL